MTKTSFISGLRLRVLTLALALTCFSAAFASAAQALPAHFWGVVPQNFPTAEQLQTLGDGGVESIRIPVVWPAVQPNKGQAFDWSSIDPQVGAAAQAGVEVLPFLANAPSWAVPSAPIPGAGKSTAPAHLPVSGAARSGWSAFLTAAVGRYGPSGTYWSEHPAIPKRPIRNWQIWNEPNFKYFVARPNPAEYGKLVANSYTAIKAVDPGAKVILGGLFGEPIEATRNYKPPRAYFATDFLEQMYKHNPGIKSKFNGVALHPYTTDFHRLKPEIESVRKILAANHDGAKSLWITELGWSSKPPAASSDGFAKGANGQVTQLKGAFTMLKQNQRKWHIQSVYWFSVDDSPGSCNFCDGSGLFAAGFIPKKSWYAYVKFTGGTP